MVGVTKIQRGNANYWLSAVAQGGDDYYTKPGEAPGEWIGDLAEDLGLFGQVDPEDYSAILEGRDPISGEQLLERPSIRHRLRPDGSQKTIEPVLGYDIRFSAPKSISLLYALGSERTRERIIGVMNEAVGEGIAHMEEKACMVQRGAGGKRIERGAGLVGMAFRHRLSRAGDPALHVHVVISNLTRAVSDGKWLSLASPEGRSPLYLQAKTAGVFFQAALRAGFLREFGLEFNPIRHGYADLKGFSRELIEAFSTRSREIAAWMQAHGATSARAAQTAAYRTRDPKDDGIAVRERVQGWEATAAPFGLTPQSAEGMIEAGSPREPRPITEEILTAAVANLEATTSYFDRRELLWAIADLLPDGGGRRALNAAADRALASDLVVQIHASTDILDPNAYTTPRLAAMERRFIAKALAGVDAGVGVVDNSTLETVLARHSYLGDDQREMVVRLTTGGERIIPVAAWPGTGKTTGLRAASDAWTEAGFSVFGCATARTATGSLIEAGITNSFSIASLRYQVEHMGRLLPERAIVLLDEANVTDTFDFDALLSLVEAAGGKLVLVGDSQQIGSIGPGGMFAHTVRQLDPVTLTEIRRQHLQVDKEIVTLVHEGRGSDALDLLRIDDKLVVADCLPEALHALLLDWHRDFSAGVDAVMIARQNRDVATLNEWARQLRRAEGKLGRFEVRVGEQSIARGDRVQTRINNREVSNRERWDVVAVNPLTRTVKLRSVDVQGRVVRLDRDYLARITRDGAPALQLSYAITKYGAESKTFDRAYPLLEAGADLEQELVALSRGRTIANAYTVATSELVDPDLGPGRRELTDLLQDARESIENEGADTPALEVSLRRKIASLSPTALANRREQLAAPARAADPDHFRRERLERAVRRGREDVAWLCAERESAERLGDPPHEIAALVAREVSNDEALRRDEAELAALPPLSAAEPKPASPEERLEAVLIEQHIHDRARAEVAIARGGESDIVFNTLGSCPEDPGLAAVWADAAHAVAVYRLRYGIRSDDSALGHREPTTAAARADRARVAHRVESARRQLPQSHDRSAHTQLSHDIGIGR